MGRKGEVTRHTLIETARRLFRLQGYFNTSIDDISKASGINRGNLYFHFRSKEELAVAALEQALEKEFPFLERFMGDEEDPLRRLELMIGGIVGYNQKRGCKGG